MKRDVITVRGADAATYLHGQLSQDITGMAVGATRWSFILQPTGKVDALVRVHRVEPDGFELDVDAGHGTAVLARVRRFMIRVAVELDGPVERERPLPYSDERSRIEQGWPAMGAEITEGTIPAETGVVSEAVSFTKGCYTGQELVERIDSRGGNVARHLRRLQLTGPVTVGARLRHDGKDVGWVTSVAGDLALGYVGRAVEPPAGVEVDTGGEPRRATVLA